MARSWQDKVKAAKPVRRTVKVCLDGDLITHWQEAQETLEAVQAEHVDASNHNHPLAEVTVRKNEAEQRVRDLETAMDEEALACTFAGLSTQAYNQLVAAHPPLPDSDAGFDPATFFPALIRDTLVDPDVSGDEDWEMLYGALNDAQFDMLVGAALQVCRPPGGGAVPKSSTVSALTTSSGGTSSVRAPQDHRSPASGEKS